MRQEFQEKESIRKRIMAEIDFTRELSEEELKAIIDRSIQEQKNFSYINLRRREELRKELFDSMRKWDVLQDLMDDPHVTEIMVNGMEHIFYEKKGALHRYEKQFESRESLHHVIQQMAAGCNRVVNEASPIVDARLGDGSRVNIVLESVARNGPILTIRRFPSEPITMDKLIEYHTITSQAGEWLNSMVKAGYNILVSGGTGSGKTTFLNVLSNFIPYTERVVTIEDNAELQIRTIPNIVKLESRNANVEGCLEIGIRDLVKTSLRMRPDRIIVGEIRGGEAVDFLQAVNTGHRGSMCTIHANSAKDSISRLETMVLMGVDLPLPAIRRQIASGIDIIIHLGRVRDKSRRVLEISEVEGYKEGEVSVGSLYEFEENKRPGSDQKEEVKGELKKKGEVLHEKKLRESGIIL